MKSAREIVLRRWAITRLLRPASRTSSASRISASEWGSSDDVASSSIKNALEQGRRAHQVDVHADEPGDRHPR